MTFQKAYKALFKQESNREKGTLYFFKSRLRRTDVNGNVKDRYQAHADFLLTVGKQLIVEQALEFFGMEDLYGKPTRNIATTDVLKTKQEKAIALSCALDKFISHYDYCSFNILEKERPQSSQAPETVLQTNYDIVGKTSDGKLLISKHLIEVPLKHAAGPDRLQNYCSNVCHWALHLMSLNDTAKEGDLERLIPNIMYMIPFFFSHSPLSKYMIENIQFIAQTEFLLSPLQKLRVLEGAFVNHYGGKGKNVEADLAQEHSVRNAKELIRRLGANKTEEAILRATRAADFVNDLTKQIEKSLSIKPKSTSHTRKSTDEDVKIIQKILREVRPFNNVPNRECQGFNKIGSSPFADIKKERMYDRMAECIKRFLRGQSVSAYADE